MHSTHLPSTATFYTLGCKLNFSETSTIEAMLFERGIARALPSQSPDICIVNTCSVTEMADKKGRNLIRRINARYPDAAIFVTGCYAQLKPEEISNLPGVVAVVGSAEKLKPESWFDPWLAEIKAQHHRQQAQINVTPHKDIAEFTPSCERGDRTRFFLKVQDGCNYYCTYCTIPLARGRSRSGSIEQITDLARQAAEKGGKEIVLTGVNTGDFGNGSNYNFFDLIRELDKIEGIERFRISSIEPNLLSDEIISWIANESRAFMPHFHIPLQAGSDEVLRLMARRYDTSLFAHKISQIRQLIPDAFIGVDIIAGARGETSQLWEESLAFAKSLPVSKYHVFPYSERPNTTALRLGNIVDQATKHQRANLLGEVSNQKLHDFISSQIGTTRPVLWESHAKNEKMYGLTDNYIRVEAPLDLQLINRITPATLLKLNDNPESPVVCEIIK